MKFAKSILCIGAGYVGGPTMAVIAAKCPECKVTVVDINEDRIRGWNSDKLPIYEPGLDAIVKQCRGKNLFFSTDIPQGIRDSEIIFVSVNTPTKTFGEGAGMASDVQYLERTARDILAHSRSSKIVIEKSTIPVKTAQAMENIFLSSPRSGVHFEVLSNPEFLAEGTAIRDLENPDRVLIGSRETPTGITARQTLVDIYAQWVPRERIITSNIWSSELSKLVANAFLAQRVSSINAVSALCEKTQADVREISRAIGADSRIGAKFLNAGIGFGGSCFKKDILNLVYLCRSYGLEEVANYWESVVKINEYQLGRFFSKMLKAMLGTMSGKRICLYGFAFKADTGDTRESPAKYLTHKLLAENAMVTISDPQANDNAKIDLAGYGEAIQYIADPLDAARDADALVVMTDWDIYRKIDYAQVFQKMRKPAFIFDGRNILDHKKCFELGFNVFPIGQQELTHLKYE
ncbi:MAG: nucleotide sugar dehydrogenase [Deltaproteobacteria bacterium]|nr:nucleotide sugar dehydrogenase [Deltaproteobacteria bacterium]